MSVYLRKIDNIAFIEFEMPESKVNLLDSTALEQLDYFLDDIGSDGSLEALVISSKKPNVFIAGADIKEIEQIEDAKDGQSKAKQGQDIMNKIEDLKIPSIAVIDGVALGGGCELALACLYRIATFNEKVKIGLPEVNLGFVPGFGGTYRLPRVVGLSEGLKMILSGKPIDSTKALRIGLVDKLVPQKGIEQHISDFITDIRAGRLKKKKYKRRKKRGMKQFLDENFIGQRMVFRESLKSVLKLTKGFYPAPVKAIAVVKENFHCGRKKGMAIESKAFGQLAITSVSKSLVRVFYLSEKFKKLSIEGGDDIEPTKIDKCGILGAGIMGGGIAQLLSSRDIWVRMKDINYGAISSGLKAADKIYQGAVKKRKFTPAQAIMKMGKITGTVDYSGFANTDIVIEAVVEDMDIKKKVFQELSDVVGEDTILASNTSALSISEMADAAKDPTRVIGFHFFNPVHRMPLVEVIRTEKTSLQTVVTALNLVKRLGKTPILVKDSCGFIVNRILLVYMAEAGRILEETGQMEAIDHVMTEFGMPMGPFTLSDEVGLDVGIKVMKILEEKFGERFKPVEVFERVYEQGLLGKKTGKGFYIHKKERVPNNDIVKLLPVHSASLDGEECLNRLILIMINEAARCLQEGIVYHADAIDVGMIFGTGFPPFHGGLLRYADKMGAGQIVNKLEKLATQYQSERFQPCTYLINLKTQGKGFYSE